MILATNDRLNLNYIFNCFVAKKPKGLKLSHCVQAMKEHWEKFVNVVPAFNEHFLQKLNHAGTLSNWRIEEIAHMIHKLDKSPKIYDIFTVEREIEDFIKLCVILRNEAETRDFGHKLLLTAYKQCQ